MDEVRREIVENKFIQERLAALTHVDLWLDALTSISISGRDGISPEILVKQIMRQNKIARYPLSLSVVAHRIAETIAEEFRAVVRQDHRNRLFWRQPEPDINDIDPAIRSRVEAEVLLISTTQEVMESIAKENGFYGLLDIVRAVAKRLQQDEDAIRDRVVSIVQQSRFLYSEAQGIMRPRDANPRTRRQNMVMFELLAHNPRQV